MTVAELITQLQSQPPEAEILLNLKYIDFQVDSWINRLGDGRKYVRIIF